jgi:hypothetical protein
MALTDVYSTGAVAGPVRFTRSFPGSGVPYEALARLSVLRGEAVRTMQLLRFLARSPQACLILMLTGTVTLVWASQGSSNATLKSDFCWVLGVLIGIVAMIQNHIRFYARTSCRVKLRQAASGLRLLLFYTGAAWGMGAFLVMPLLPAPALALGFAVLPSLALSLLLKDTKGAAAFGAPAMLASAIAAISGAWPSGLWVAAILLVAGLSICCLPMLQSIIHIHRTQQDALPDLASD